MQPPPRCAIPFSLVSLVPGAIRPVAAMVVRRFCKTPLHRPGHLLRSVLADKQANAQLPAPFVFINALNECAEGNYLKPDMRDSHEYLEMIREIIELTHEPA